MYLRDLRKYFAFRFTLHTPSSLRKAQPLCAGIHSLVPKDCKGDYDANTEVEKKTRFNAMLTHLRELLSINLGYIMLVGTTPECGL